MFEQKRMSKRMMLRWIHAKVEEENEEIEQTQPLKKEIKEVFEQKPTLKRLVTSLNRSGNLRKIIRTDVFGRKRTMKITIISLNKTQCCR